MTQASPSKTKKPAGSVRAKASSKRVKNSVTFTFTQIGVAVIIALLVVNVALIAGYTKVRSVRSEANRIVLLNEPLTYNGVTVEAENVKVEDGYIMGIRPAADEKIISVQVTIHNNSDTDFEFYPTAQTFVRDNQGSQYIMVPVELRIPFAATTIKPGQVKTGQLSYLVSNRAVPLFMYIESRQAAAGPFVIKIQ